jgi:predicted RNA-binding Zn-ribbon protein involved in translation (DUF1610 family)
MAAREEPNTEARNAAGKGALIYVPCPECGRAVLLADSQVADEPETYECPTCGTRFASV